MRILAPLAVTLLIASGVFGRYCYQCEFDIREGNKGNASCYGKDVTKWNIQTCPTGITYCTTGVLEYKSSSSVIAFGRGCDKEGGLYGVMENEIVREYKTVCNHDLCNSGNGIRNEHSTTLFILFVVAVYQSLRLKM